MTAEGQAREPAPELAGGPGTAVPASTVLDLCDGLLGEIGRRMHRFAWLRPPGAGIEDCLPVDAYYPGNRLVVMCRPAGAELDPHYAEQFPRNGLHLLAVTPSELGPDRRTARDALFARINALGPRPARPHERVVVARSPPALTAAARAAFAPAAPRPAANASPAPVPAPARASASASAQPAAAAAAAPMLAPDAGPAPVPAPVSVPAPAPAPASTAPLDAGSRPAARARPRPARQPPPRHPPQTTHTPAQEQRSGMLLGVGLVVVLVAEALVLVIAVALGNGHPVLALGFALDGCARALGTIAAAREGDHERAWTIVLLGSPAVTSWVLLGPDGNVTTEPAPLAGVMSVLAMSLIAVALLGALVGI